MERDEDSLFAGLKQLAAKRDGRFLFDEERSYTAAEVYSEAVALANDFYGYGVRKGSLVAFRCTRSIDGFLIWLALESMGATVAMTDPHRTVEQFLADAAVPVKADFIITNERAGGGTSANGDWEIIGKGGFSIFYPARRAEKNFPEQRDTDAPATIFFTSGSTGRSKGAVISQRALLQRARDLTSREWYHAGDVVMVTLPVHHAFGLLSVHTAIYAGYSLFFPRYNGVEYALRCVETYKVTGMDAVPSYFYALAKANERERRDVSTLRIGFAGGAPVSPEQHRYIERSLGMTLHILYAMSECMSISNTFPEDGPKDRSETVGRAHRNAVSILGKDGNELLCGEEGEICVFGPAVMSGYFNNEEETKRVIDGKGRFHTGDLGFFDGAGRLHISGRIKDIIIRNGINLSPSKIEAGLRSIPGVENAVVVGVRHEMLGEAPCALVVLGKGCRMTEEELRKECADRMPKNEIPVSFAFAETIPLNGMGKPDKRAVERLWPGAQEDEKSLWQFLGDYAASSPGKCFLTDKTRSYTAEQTLWAVTALCNRLSGLGIEAGSMVALRCTRSLDTALFCLALFSLGATAVLTDPHEEAEAFLRGMGTEVSCAAVITNERAGGGIDANGNWEVSGTAVVIDYPVRREVQRFKAARDIRSPAVLIFTSGSTGKGKAVMLSQSNLISHVRNVSYAGCYAADDVFLQTLPLHHVFGLAVILTALIHRLTVVFPEKTDIETVAAGIGRYGITRLDGVPSFALALAEYHRKTQFRCDSLRVGILGGAPSSKEQFEMIESELDVTLLPVYGQSECISISGAGSERSALVRASTVGAFLPLNECRIFKEDGKEAGIGEEGEICVKGPVVMLGYYNDEEGTAEALGGGWLHTGDLGFLDGAGDVHISGRKKDIIIRNGNNLSAGKIEKALSDLPEVACAAVVGVRHERVGEVPCALVVLRENSSEEALKEKLKGSLIKNEIPERIVFSEALPLTPSGKPDKQKIKELF